MFFFKDFVAAELDGGDFHEALLIGTQARGFGIEQNKSDLGNGRVGCGRAGGQFRNRIAAEQTHGTDAGGCQ
ncbi:MAG: hypothetical protein NTY53_19155 [Kiritimatiellaeota bacterium]|nr:hypothetical protein [Kiritimatiellota bacterium]